MALEDAVNTEPNDNADNLPNIERDFPNCDGIIIDNLPEDITEENISELLESAVLNSGDGITIHPTGSLRGKLVKNVKIESISTLIKIIDKKSLKGRTLHCKPHIPATPPKKKDDEDPNPAELSDDAISTV